MFTSKTKTTLFITLLVKYKIKNFTNEVNLKREL